MLTIRKEQEEALGRDRLRRFVIQMEQHLRQFFPARCAELGDEAVREWIHHGIERAAVYGVVAERDVCKYIDVMFTCGREFDEDPKLPWAREILTAQPTYPRVKMDQLVATAAWRQEGVHV
jgi:hypothetical protein